MWRYGPITPRKDVLLSRAATFSWPAHIKGSAFSASDTSAAMVSIPFLKSIGCAAKKMRRPPEIPIMPFRAAPPARF